MIVMDRHSKEQMKKRGQQWAFLGQIVLVLLDETLQEPIMSFEERTIKYRELLPKYLKARCEHTVLCEHCVASIDDLAKQRDSFLSAVALVLFKEAANGEV